MDDATDSKVTSGIAADTLGPENLVPRTEYEELEAKYLVLSAELEDMSRIARQAQRLESELEDLNAQHSALIIKYKSILEPFVDWAFDDVDDEEDDNERGRHKSKVEES